MRLLKEWCGTPRQCAMPFSGQTLFDVVDQVTAASQVSLKSGTRCSTRSGNWALRMGSLNLVPADPRESPPVIASAMPRGWLDGYQQNELQTGDMVLARARASTNSFQWEMADWAADKLTPG